MILQTAVSAFGMHLLCFLNISSYGKEAVSAEAVPSETVEVMSVNSGDTYFEDVLTG